MKKKIRKSTWIRLVLLLMLASIIIYSIFKVENGANRADYWGTLLWGGQPERLYHEVQGVQTDDPRELHILIRLYLLRNDIQNATKYINELEKISGTNDKVLTGRGDIAFGQRDFDTAIEYYQSAIESGTSWWYPYNQLAFTLRRNGELEEALRTVNEALNLFPDNSDLMSTKSLILYDMGQTDSALSLLRENAWLNPNIIRPETIRIELLIRENRTEEYINEFEEDPQYISNTYPGLLSFIGEAYMMNFDETRNSTRYEEANRIIDTALSNDPQNVRAQFIKARLLLREENLDVEGSEKILLSIINESPYWDSYAALAFINHKYYNNSQKAMEYSLKAIEFHEKNQIKISCLPYLILAEIYNKRGDLAVANAYEQEAKSAELPCRYSTINP